MARFIQFTAAALLVAGAGCLIAPAHACEPLDADAPNVAAAIKKDAAGRPVALININGQGPFRFIIDTGANRSVLSRALATRLGLAYSGEDIVHSIEGSEPANMVNVESLSFGELLLSKGDTPVLDGPMLDGQHGLLGVDGMAGRLLHIDFTKHCAAIYESAAQMSMQGWMSAPAQMRFGTMLLVEGEIMGVRVNVLIDTGSEVSLANQQFRDSLRIVKARTIEYRGERAFTFGRPIVLEQSVWTPVLRLGRSMVVGVNAYIGDFHIFDVWGLQDEPTVLIGMDSLARSREMAIDYEKGIVYFRKKPSGDIPGGRPAVEGATVVAAPSNGESAPSAIPPSLSRP
jgi:predicted aspartyl protease